MCRGYAEGGVFAYLASVRARADARYASPVLSGRGWSVQIHSGGLSEQSPAAPERERCPGIFMVDVFDVGRFLECFGVGYGFDYLGGDIVEAVLPVLRSLLGLRKMTI